MEIRIGGGASDEEARVIGSALAEHVGESIEVYVGDGDEPATTADPPAGDDSEPDGASASSTEPDLGPTDREKRLRKEIAEIEQGGPEKYKDRLSDQGKLFVRDRLDLWFDEGSRLRGRPVRRVRRRRPVARRRPHHGRRRVRGPRLSTSWRTTSPSRRRSWPEGRREVPPDATARAEDRETSALPDGFLGRAASTSRPVSSPTARASGSTTTTTRCSPGASRRSASSTGPASRARPTRPSSRISPSWSRG